LRLTFNMERPGRDMKATIEFDLPDEQEDLERCIHSLDWALTVHDLDQELRKFLKYGHTFKTPDDALETIRQRLFDILEEHNINLDMIT